MKFKKDAEGALVLDDNGDPIAIDSAGEAIPLDKVVSLGKHQRIEGERDEYKGQVEKLTTQIGDLSKVSGDKAELEKKLAEITTASETTKTELETRLAARDKEYALDTTLLGAGIPKERLRAAKANLDMEAVKLEGDKLTGFDVDAFVKENDYLLGTVKTVDSAAASRGAAGADDNTEQVRAAMGLPPKKE